MNTAMYVVLAVSLTASAALAYLIWRLDRRAERLALEEAERIVSAEARRMSYWEMP